MSDWGAAHSTVGTFRHGLDLEMPGPEYLNRGALKPLLERGELSMATLDDKVRRILRVTYAMGFADRPQENASIPKADPASERAALEVARAGTVLLQNRNNLLPLARGKVKRILVVGPNADPAVTGAGGSSYTTPTKATSLLDAIRAAAGAGVQVQYHRGTPDPLRVAKNTEVSHPDRAGTTAWRAEYFANANLEGTPALTRDDRQIDFDWRRDAPATGLPSQRFSVRWTGIYRTKHAGEHLFVAKTDDGVRVSVDGKRVIDSWGDRGATMDTATVKLEANRDYRVVVEYYQAAGDASAQFGINPTGWVMDRDLTPEIVRGADAVVVATGLNPNVEGEGFDRPFELPEGQRALLRYVQALNPRTILVNNSGGPVDLAAFAPKAGAILQAWYPGMNGNQAVAEILFGALNPSGKLPLSWPRTLTGTYYADAYPPKDHKMPYREGLFIGYRWFDANGQAPLFPFGHGLSYTTFALGKPTARLNGAGLEIVVPVRNTGRRAGAETLQVYTGTPSSPVKRPVRELRAFARVTLRPGESQTVTMQVPRSDLAYWDVTRKGWVVPTGPLDVSVGTSSRNLPYRVRVDVR
jgi:beta-glucosidase